MLSRVVKSVSVKYPNLLFISVTLFLRGMKSELYLNPFIPSKLSTIFPKLSETSSNCVCINGPIA